MAVACCGNLFKFVMYPEQLGKYESCFMEISGVHSVQS